MAALVVNNFDVYNTTKYWTGYSFPGYTIEQQVAFVYYFTQFSSSPYGSQIDFFKELAGDINQNPTFQLNTTENEITLNTLPYLWSKYWWDKAVYYSNSIVYNTLTASASGYYQPFSESVGTLYYLSRVNNLQNTETKVYSLVIKPLINQEISEGINTFYSTANALFLNNKALIGPGTGTDTNPGSGANGTLIQANTDLTRRITSNLSLTATVNEAYPYLSSFLPYNTELFGNQLTPYYWSLSADCEETAIRVDFTNRNVTDSTQLVTGDLIAK